MEELHDHDGHTMTEQEAHKQTNVYTRDIFAEKKLWTPFGKISWGAIIAGALVTAVCQMLLSLLGMGIGLSTVDPLREQNPMEGLGIGSIIWWSATMLISLFAGGFVTGKMYLTRSREYLTLHGLLTWCTFTVFSFFMLTTSVGKLVSGLGSVVGTTLTAGANVSNTNALDISSLTREAENLLLQPVAVNENNQINGGQVTSSLNRNNGLRSSGTDTRQGTALNNSAVGNRPLLNDVTNFFGSGNMNDPQAREALVNSLVRETGLSRSEANEQVNKWMATYEELKAKAKIKANQAAKAVSIASIIGFFALLLGALVTVLGARIAPMREYSLAKMPENDRVSVTPPVH